MDELSTRARAYLAAFAVELQAPASMPRRELPAPRAVASAWRFIVPLLGIAAVAIVGVGASRTTATRDEPVAQFEAAPHRVERAVVEDVAQPRAHVRAFVRHRLPRIARPVAPPTIAPPPARAEHARDPGPSSLRRELALVDAAKASLRRGDLDAARQLLARHAKRFPNGLLAPERRRLIERIDEDTESSTCVHSSCVRDSEREESTR